MGWSCRVEAARTLESWIAYCRRQSGQSNVFYTNGKSYFFEEDNVEHDDGAITGSVWFMGKNQTCSKYGTFRVNGDGTVDHGPTVLQHLTEG
jgi:hypothetical protein